MWVHPAPPREVYGAGDSAVTALDGVTLSLSAGSFTGVMGPSGSGKSTLLQCAAGLDRPDRGSAPPGRRPVPLARLSKSNRQRITPATQRTGARSAIRPRTGWTRTPVTRGGPAVLRSVWWPGGCLRQRCRLRPDPRGGRSSGRRSRRPGREGRPRAGPDAARRPA
ncbi:ATP-binding cassette domain-containing protein [Streptomyces sp. NPDC053728]|uniref:ATP-binding cassette domain-containing protein n=1 Tax=Streptomyces sp. NPDC053728 TaxID=3155534 RepID=UPI0034166552